MAYAANVSVLQVGRQEYRVRIEETDADATSEAVIEGVPLVARVLRQVCVIQAGSATTVWPVLGEITPADTSDRIIVEPSEAAALVDIQGVATYFDATKDPVLPAGRLYHMSRPDVGADNQIVTVYHISTAW